MEPPFLPLGTMKGTSRSITISFDSTTLTNPTGAPMMRGIDELAKPDQSRGGVPDGEDDGLLPGDLGPALHAHGGTGASALLGLCHDVVVADEAVHLPAERRELLLVDPRCGHLGVGDDIRPVPDGLDADVGRVLGERQVVSVVEVRRGVDASLDDGELRLGPGPAVELRGYDLHAALLDVLGFDEFQCHLNHFRFCILWV